MYSLNLTGDGRILSATYPKYDDKGIQVEKLPDGDISDYKYIDSKYVYEPLPIPPSPPTENDTLENLAKRVSDLEKATIER